MSETKPNLPQEILAVLKKHAELPHEYWNPHFLSEINGLLDSYYNLEDPVVDKWIQEMHGA
jgi:hypothetical protein